VYHFIFSVDRLRGVIRVLTVAVILLFLSYPLFAFRLDSLGTDSLLRKKEYLTKRVQQAPPNIDGKLDDDAWQTVEWGGDFLQRFPDAGKAPSEQTEFKILYDEKNLYVAIRAFDDPDKIVRRMSRRDGFEGDWVEVEIDSYFDHLTAWSFTASASGVKGDEAITNNGDDWDSNWDPIWFVKTAIDDKGWIAEIRIPLSQLRFPEKREQTWGIQIQRRHFRHQEISTWQYVPRDAPGWVHLFGELHGLEGIKPQKQLEIQPYVLGKFETFEKEAGNPYATGRSSGFNAGIDGKIGLTSNMTLDFTINPDFGQVEADPSVINLTGFQNYFSERRPFFIEGKSIVDFPLSQSIAWGDHNSDNLFYSRRIGHAPQYSPDLGDNEYADIPDNTTILGALKLTGKTKSGLSIGVLESLTQKEKAEIASGDSRKEITVEPLTNYLLSRVQQDFNKGNTQIGGMFTAVNRKLEDDHLLYLHKSAYTGGIDFIHNWKNRTWYVSGNMILSQVRGTRESIKQTQESQEHLYQRPDADYFRVDSTLTSLSGYSGTLKFGKGGNGNIRFQLGGTFRTPGVELNDIGFMRQADAIYQFLWSQYQLQKPWKFLRSFSFNFNQWTNWDFGRNNTYVAANYNTHFNFTNFMSVGTGLTHAWRQVSNTDLRGGPALVYPSNTSFFYYFNSDQRKKLSLGFEHNITSSQYDYKNESAIYTWIQYQPLNALSISLQPGLTETKNEMQYVDTQDFQGTPRYILGRIDQNTFSMTVRVNLNITPNLTIQYYGQPFTSNGGYSNFKTVTDSRAENFFDRYHLYEEAQITFDQADNTYLVDEQGDGQTDYSFSNPDFDFVQFRSNMVLRWEYIPGSTIFLVWSQFRTGDLQLDDHSFGKLSNELFDIVPRNIFFLKVSYRFVK
jgi:Domain of unknown function (DUF5916)/Carbohydrate family 9 binding domain-like